MNGPTMETLVRRLDRLERQVRWWRLVAVVAGGPLVLVGLVAATQRAPVVEELRARRFTLIDDKGHERARLAMTFKNNSGDIEPELWIGNENKDGTGTYVYPYGLSTRAKSGNGFVNLNPLGLRIALENVEMEINSGLGVGGPRIKLTGPSPILVLADNGGQYRAVLGELTEFGAIFGRSGAAIKRPVPSLVLFDKDGKAIWSAP